MANNTNPDKVYKEFGVKTGENTSEFFEIGADARNVFIQNGQGNGYGDADGVVDLQTKLNNFNRSIRNIGSGTASNKCATAFGYNTSAGGESSHAEGHQTQALGSYSHAEGYSTIAQGSASHAEGTNTIAYAPSSHAEGEGSHAEGFASHAEGYQTVAQGKYAHAEGNSTTASGDYSHAEGADATASGEGSHAEGAYTKAEGLHSHAEGSGTLAYGMSSHAECYQTQANGDGSHAEGYLTQANGKYSHAEGYKTLAQGNYSHAEGNGTKAIGDYSHAKGVSTIAEGEGAHVEGKDNITDSLYSHIEGIGHRACGDFQRIDSNNQLLLDGCNFSFVDNLSVVDDWKNQFGLNELNINNLDKYTYLMSCTLDQSESRFDNSFINKNDKLQYFQGNLINARLTFENLICCINNFTNAQGVAKYSINIFSQTSSLSGLLYEYFLATNKIIYGAHILQTGSHVQGCYSLLNDYNYAHVVGNGKSSNQRSNAHTIDWNGNAMFAGDINFQYTYNQWSGMNNSPTGNTVTINKSLSEILSDLNDRINYLEAKG